MFVLGMAWIMHSVSMHYIFTFLAGICDNGSVLFGLIGVVRGGGGGGVRVRGIEVHGIV